MDEKNKTKQNSALVKSERKKSKWKSWILYVARRTTSGWAPAPRNSSSLTDQAGALSLIDPWISRYNARTWIGLALVVLSRSLSLSACLSRSVRLSAYNAPRRRSHRAWNCSRFSYRATRKLVPRKLQQTFPPDNVFSFSLGTLESLLLRFRLENHRVFFFLYGVSFEINYWNWPPGVLASVALHQSMRFLNDWSTVARRILKVKRRELLEANQLIARFRVLAQGISQLLHLPAWLKTIAITRASVFSIFVLIFASFSPGAETEAGTWRGFLAFTVKKCANSGKWHFTKHPVIERRTGANEIALNSSTFFHVQQWK